MKKDLYKRFEIIESHLPVYRSELYKMMETAEGRTLSKLKELKDALSQTILTNFTALDDRVDQFSELVSFLVLSIPSRSTLTDLFERIGGQQPGDPAPGPLRKQGSLRQHH